MAEYIAVILLALIFLLAFVLIIVQAISSCFPNSKVDKFIWKIRNKIIGE
jgi:hypothetical protein